MLHQVGVLFDLYYDARKHKIKILRFLPCVAQDSILCRTVVLAVTVEPFGCGDVRWQSQCQIRRATTICQVARYYSGDQIRVVEMVVARGRCGEEKHIEGFVWIRRQENHWHGLEADDSVISKWILKLQDVEM